MKTRHAIADSRHAASISCSKARRLPFGIDRPVRQGWFPRGKPISTLYSSIAGIRQKNTALEAAGLEWFGFRLPSLRVECHYHYKAVESASFGVGVHAHDHWEMSRPVRGAARYLVVDEAGTVEVNPGPDCFLVIPPRRAHSWEMTRSPLLLNSWQVRLEPEDEVGVRLLSSLREVVRAAGFQAPATAYQTEAEDLLWSMTAQNVPPSLLGPMVNGVARIFIGGIVGRVEPWPPELHERASQFHNSAENLAKKIRDFLEANVHNPVTMVELESHFHYSSRQMNRIFQDYFHITISQYLRDRRFDLATRWLATTNRSIKDIALSLGFGSVSHFCRYFRRLKKLSPTEYRELIPTVAGSESFVENPRGAKGK